MSKIAMSGELRDLRCTFGKASLCWSFSFFALELPFPLLQKFNITQNQAEDLRNFARYYFFDHYKRKRATINISKEFQ